MQTLHVRLEYPLNHVCDPVIYHLIKDYRLVPNILRARIDIHQGGTLQIQLDGVEADLAAGLEFLKSQGIGVTRLEDAE